MAQMIPDAMPAGRSLGENLLFSKLQLLSDDCFVYYEPAVGDRYPDFVVIIPDSGLLVIEVKGWLPHQLLGGDSHDIRVRMSAREPERRSSNPIRQAREYMHKLMDLCRRHPAGRHLLQKDGPHAGRFVFPFGFCAVLTQITDEQLRNHASGNVRSILPEDHVVAADEFDAWAALTAVQLEERLASFFRPAWPFPALTEPQVRALRTILHPEVLVPPTPSELAGLADLAMHVLTVPAAIDLKSLDAGQEREARALGGGHRLLFGVAGSGKTVVLVARAKFLSEGKPRGRILVLCFNVTFKSYLGALLAQCANVDVMTFHGWGARNGVPFHDETPQEYGERLLAVLQAGEGDAGQYDAVLIDEAQDFDPSWFACARTAMREPRGGDLLIVGDRNQTNYQRGRASWASLGINAKGRSRILRQNYRNTRRILAAAAQFAEDAEEEDGIAATGCDPHHASRDTPIQPVLIERRTRREEIERVESVVRDLLAGTFAAPHLPPLRPSDIGLLYRRTDKALPDLLTCLEQLAPVVWLNQPAGSPGSDSRQRVLEPGLKVQTIFSAKGLQYRAVVLLFADQLGTRSEELEKDTRLLYVALTRPEDVLAVSCARASSAPRPPLLEALIASKAFRLE